MLGVMRDKNIWGEDADEFKSERWIGVEEEKLREMESTLNLVFSNGRWQCLGGEIAMMELNKIFVEVGAGFVFGLLEKSLTADCV